MAIAIAAPGKESKMPRKAKNPETPSVPMVASVRSHHAAGSHHVAAHHSLHHRSHALVYEPGHLTGVCSDSFRQRGISGGFLGDDAGGSEGERAAVAAGISEEGRQSPTHAGDLGVLVEMRVHA